MYHTPGFIELILTFPYIALMDAIRQESYLLGIAALIAAVVYVVLAVLVIGGIFYLLDSAFIPTREVMGRITGLKYTPRRTTLVPVTVGKITTLQPMTYPEHWEASLEVKGEILECSITHKQYTILQHGQTVKAMVGSGRLSGGAYCKEILI